MVLHDYVRVREAFQVQIFDLLERVGRAGLHVNLLLLPIFHGALPYRRVLFFNDGFRGLFQYR